MPNSLIQIEPRSPRLPEWARKNRTRFESLHRLKTGLRALNLHTVCESARCPNIHECFHRGAATFMILGNRCTRGCGFCSVPKGHPAKHDMALDPAEPRNVARMAADMQLRYVVITSVNRDDLDDGGSQHFAQTVRAVREALPDSRVVRIAASRGVALSRKVTDSVLTRTVAVVWAWSMSTKSDIRKRPAMEGCGKRLARCRLPFSCSRFSSNSNSRLVRAAARSSRTCCPVD